jgi:DNA polymerase V
MNSDNNTRKDTAMGQNQKEKFIHARPSNHAVSELHRLMGITPAEVDRQLATFGETPAQALAAFNVAMAKAKRSSAQNAIDAITKKPGTASSEAKDSRHHMGQPLFDEAVAAGFATPSSLGDSRPTQLSDLFKGLPAIDGHFYVRVSGVSMTQAGIHDGDLILVDPKGEPRMGDIVLAHIAPHGQVVKLLACDQHGLMLESANPDYQPIRISNPEELTIHGKVVWACGIRGR